MSYKYHYPRPSVTVDAIVITRFKERNSILLIRRRNEPFAGMWALPGGFIEMHEDLEQSCARELEEETGLSGITLTQFRTFGAVDRDPRGRTISVVYWGVVDKELPVTGLDDADLAEWFPLDALPGLAFDHLDIINQFKEFYKTTFRIN